MPRILYVQEFGQGFGHVKNLVALAEQLPDCDAIFALPDQGSNASLVQEKIPSAQIISAPQLTFAPAATMRRERDHTMADALQRMNYHHFPTLLARAQNWRIILDQAKPDLIVADFAPTVALAKPAAMPLLVVGNWYMVPPAARELPAVNFWENYLPPASQRREREILAAANAVRAKLGGERLKYMVDMFHGTRTFVTAFAGLDAYQRFRTEPLLSPFDVPAIDTGPPFAERYGPAIFAYLSADTPSLNVILTALNALALPSHIYVRGLAPQVVAANCAPQVRVHASPADFSQILPQVQLFINYGGSGSCYAGLLAGVPQLMIADGMEQQANAWAVETMGCGTALAVAAGGDAVVLRTRVIEPMLANRSMQARTLAISKELVATRAPNPVPILVAACREMLGLA